MNGIKEGAVDGIDNRKQTEPSLARETQTDSGVETSGSSEQEANQKSGASSEAGKVAAAAEVDQTLVFRKQIQELEEQSKEKENKYLYLYAEFENFKRRSIKERSDLLKFGWENVARDLLQTVDNLERALNHVPEGMDQNFVSGIQMVLSEMKNTLKKQGVQTVESIGKDFDPTVHEAVAQEKSEIPAGKILRELLQGYTLHGRLLRPARVVISQDQES